MDTLGNLNELLEALLSNGPVGIALGVIVLILVVAFRYTGLAKVGNHARLAVGLLAVLLSGAELGEFQANVTAVVAALVASALHWLGELAKKRKELSG